MKFKFLEKLKMKKLNKKSFIFIALIVFAGLSLAAPVFATPDWAINVVGGVFYVFVSAVGLILVQAIRALVYVAQYSYFLDSGAVTFGWIIVRDLCNMFFVIVLLIIAFGTILNIEKYNYKKWLPKLILMAVLINFSKTICGLLIDVAQVVMLTFVNSFSTIGSGSLLNVLGITDILALAKSDNNSSLWTVIGAYMLGLAYLVVSLIVVITMVAMLAIRIVMIWIYVVLSPLAYLLSAFPGGQSYASKWWSDFTKNLIVGPVLAFFLWLSFAALTADQTRDNNPLKKAELKEFDDATSAEQNAMTGADDPGAMGTKSSSPSALINFVIAIGMLVGGLKIAQEVGGAAGSMAGKGMAAVNKAGKIGLAGAAAVTGVRAAQGIYKNYSSARKSRREDSYKNMATKMAGGVGKVKAAVGGAAVSSLQWVKGQTLDRIGGGRRAKKMEAELNVKREELASSQQNFDQKKGPVIGSRKNKATGEMEDREYKYDENRKTWRDSKTGRAVKEDQVNEAVENKKTVIKNTQGEVDALKEKQKKIDGFLKAGVLAVGGAVALATGGIAGLALAGGAALGASKGYNRLKNAGKTDFGISSNFRLDQIKKEKGDLKDNDDKSVIAQMDDGTISAFARAAAALEAMERGLLSSDQAEAKREMIKKEIGGVDEKTKGFKDKKVGNYFEAIASRKNISATQDFQDLSSKDEAIRTRAEKNVRANFENGSLTLDKLDSAAINKLGPQIVSMMKIKDFDSQFSALKDQGKKRDIINSLKGVAGDTSYKSLSKGTTERNNAEEQRFEAMRKLNKVTDLNTATASVSNPKEKQEYQEKIVVKMGGSEIRDIFEGTNQAQKEAIQKLYADIRLEVGGNDDEAKKRMFDSSVVNYFASPAGRPTASQFNDAERNLFLPRP